MGPTLGLLSVALLVLGAVLWPLERLSPARRQGWWRADTPTDVAYWFFTPLVTRAVSRAALVAALVLLAVSAGIPLDRAHLAAFANRAGGALARQPAALQVVEVLLLGDVLGYWSHRLFHGRRMWRFHAIHHSSRDVDWLSSVRLHPFNDVLSRLAQALPLFLLGFQPGIVAAYVPFLTFYAILLHANVPWTFGPLRHVLASSTFHRWHHTTEREGLDKNFAGLFPFIDRLFGTLYLPAGRQPQEFGVLGDDVPRGLWAQLLYPFHRSGSGRAPALPLSPP